MTVFIVSSNAAFAEAVGAALQADAVGVYESSSDVIAAIVTRGSTKSHLVIIDLTTIPDAARLIDFLKSSAPTRDVFIVPAGEKEQFDALHECTRGAVDGTLQLPFTPAELAGLAARFRPGGKA